MKILALPLLFLGLAACAATAEDSSRPTLSRPSGLARVSLLSKGLE